MQPSEVDEYYDEYGPPIVSYYPPPWAIRHISMIGSHIHSGGEDSGSAAFSSWAISTGAAMTTDITDITDMTGITDITEITTAGSLIM